jgi:hypothetical protein
VNAQSPEASFTSRGEPPIGAVGWVRSDHRSRRADAVDLAWGTGSVWAYLIGQRGSAPLITARLVAIASSMTKGLPENNP